MQYVIAAFTRLFEWALEIFGKRFALAATVGASFVAGWVAVQAAIYAAWLGVGYSMPAKVAENMPYIVALLPSNLVPCFAALVTAKLIMWLWRVQGDWLRMVMAAKS